jgi:photosystem II stability/assembly factor-like uncharacterized protein
VKLSRVLPLLITLLIALLIPIEVFPATKFVSRWELFENQPNITQGGRTNSVAVNPTNASEVFAASDSGGLFKSTDGGIHWAHVDTLPVIFTQSVAWVYPNIVLVSAKADFKVKNGGGVWRSGDGGATWTQANLNIPGFTGRLSAYEISVSSSEVAVGTSEGVFLSSNGGVNWSYSDVFGSSNKTVFSVLMTSTSPTRVYAGGPSGVRLGTNPAGTWESPILDPGAAGGIRDIHAFGRSPLSASQAFVVNGSGQLFRTDNSGSIWTLMPSAPAQGQCAGISFIKAVRRGQDTLDLYFGNRCSLYRLAAPITQNTANFSGTWQEATVDHRGTRDLSFFAGNPCLLATAGGLHKTPDAGWTWTLTGGGRDGYNALQVTEIKGQLVGTTTDLYFGTRDNDLWAMNVWGNTYNFHHYAGAYIELERRVVSDDDSQITFNASGNNRVSGRHFENAHDWPDFASLGHYGSPILIRRPFYVQLTRGSHALEDGLSLYDETWGWREFAAFPEMPVDNPRLGQSDGGDLSRAAIVYQPFRSGTMLPWAGRLMRIHGRLVPQEQGTVFYPAMNGFGALGLNPTMDGVWYSVFAVDTADAAHLIAPDVVQQQMMESHDGGENWTLIHGLKDLVTDNGRLQFVTDLIGAGPVCPIVTAVSFSPQDPNLVLAGTSEGGIFYSDDRGITWKKIAGTDRATYITSFHWQNANAVSVSTFGRGVWALRNVRVAVSTVFDDVCGSCDVVANDSTPGRPPFDGSVLVFDGHILGVHTEKSQLREVFVTPGSSVAFTGDPDDPQDDIAVIESDGRDTSQFEPLPKPPADGWIATGVVFTKGDALTGTAFAKTELTLLPPPSDAKLGGSTQSPSKGTPSIRLTTAAVDVVPTAASGEAFQLAATNFLAAARYEILIDGMAIKGTVTADGNGAFVTSVTAPTEPGYHTVAVRMDGDETVIDASPLYVRN